MKDRKLLLYIDKRKCCGCSACAAICPKKAITMVEDNEGFLYPEINEFICVGCQMCKQVCAFQK